MSNFFQGNVEAWFSIADLSLYIWILSVYKKKKKNHWNHRQRTAIYLSTSSINWIDNKIVWYSKLRKSLLLFTRQFPISFLFYNLSRPKHFERVIDSGRKLLLDHDNISRLTISSKPRIFPSGNKIETSIQSIGTRFRIRNLKRIMLANQRLRLTKSNRSHSKMVDPWATRFEIGEERRRRTKEGRPRSMRNREDRLHPLLLILTYWLQYLYISIEYSGWGDAFDWRLWGHFDGWMVPLCSTLVSPWLAQGFSRAKKKRKK